MYQKKILEDVIEEKKNGLIRLQSFSYPSTASSCTPYKLVKKNMRKQSVAKYDQSEVESTSLQKVGVKSSTARFLKDVKGEIVIPSIAEGV